MRFNSPRALELGRLLFNHYGNWDAVRAAGVVRDDGVIEIQVPLALSSGEPSPQSEPQASAGNLPPDASMTHSQDEASARQGEGRPTIAAREAPILRDWTLGNLTPLGVANALIRAGFNSRYATDRANALARDGGPALSSGVTTPAVAAAKQGASVLSATDEPILSAIRPEGGGAQQVQKLHELEGWVLVPKEPTREMLNAAIDTDRFKLGDISPLGFRCSSQMMFGQCYRAMIQAAPLVEGGGSSSALADRAARAYGDAASETLRKSEGDR